MDVEIDIGKVKTGQLWRNKFWGTYFLISRIDPLVDEGINHHTRAALFFPIDHSTTTVDLGWVLQSCELIS